MLPFVIGIPIAFVAALQLVTPKSAHRNDDLVIIRRSGVTVIFTTLVYATFTHYYLPLMSSEHERDDVPLHTALIFTLVAISTLYCGPIVHCCRNGFPRHDDDSTWLQLRTLVIAPIAEEVIFRGVIFRLLLAHYTTQQAILIALPVFSLAHLHHFVHECLGSGV